MPPLLLATAAASARVPADGFPSFLPKEVTKFKDPSAIKLAKRIQRLPVEVNNSTLFQTSFTKNLILSSCVPPLMRQSLEPVVLLHSFDSSCLEWRYTYPLLEDAGVETWAVDILGWGFSDLKSLPTCDVAAKCEHLYQFWRSYINNPMVLVGPSLGAAVAIDFASNHPEAVAKLVFIDASVYAEGTQNLTKLPKLLAYAGVLVLKSLPLRLYATTLAFNKVPDVGSVIDWTNVGRLHCLLPWWEDVTVDFMLSGGYNVVNQIRQIKHKSLIIWGEDDQIISNKTALRLESEIPDSVLCQIPHCGHIPHIEKPEVVAKLILEFLDQNYVEKPPSHTTYCEQTR